MPKGALVALGAMVVVLGVLRLPLGCSGERGPGTEHDGGGDSPDVEDATTIDADATGDGPLVGDGGWTSMGWPEGCSFAWKAPIGIPQQQWDDCGVAGCFKLKLSYDFEDFQPIAVAQVSGSGPALRLLLVYRRKKTPKFETAYLTLDRDGDPIQLLNAIECAPFLGLSPSGNCAVKPSPDGGASQGALFGPQTPPVPPLQAFPSAGTFEVACTKDLLVSDDIQDDPVVRDLLAEKEYVLLPPNGKAFDPRLYAEHAFFMRYGVESGQVVLDGWLWKRPNEIVKLIDPGTQKVFDIRTDGTTLVWTQVNAPDVFDAYPGDLWTSPFSTTASGVKAEKRRSIPVSTVGRGNYAIGGGHYALVEGALSTTKTKLHVYRLSDARHWEVPQPPGLVNSTVLYIDDNEVWYLARLPNGLNQTVARQRLDALGPGD